MTQALPLGMTQALPLGMTQALPLGMTQALPLGMTQVMPHRIIQTIAPAVHRVTIRTVKLRIHAPLHLRLQLIHARLPTFDKFCHQ